jgi:hypothetical protein
VDAKACQVESWVRRNEGSTEYWALPGCNFTGNLELTLGGARTSDTTGSPLTRMVLQGKTILKPREKNGWGLGLAAGTIRRSQQTAVPVLFAPMDRARACASRCNLRQPPRWRE